MGGRNFATMESFESSGLGFTWGRRMKVDVHKTGATSRHSGSTPRRCRKFISQRREVETNTATFQKGKIAKSRRSDSTSRRSRESINPTSRLSNPTSRRSNPTSRRSREWCQLTSRCWSQRRDVLGGVKIGIANIATLQRLDFFGFDQRCDVDIQCRDVT